MLRKHKVMVSLIMKEIARLENALNQRIFTIRSKQMATGLLFFNKFLLILFLQ